VTEAGCRQKQFIGGEGIAIGNRYRFDRRSLAADASRLRRGGSA